MQNRKTVGELWNNQLHMDAEVGRGRQAESGSADNCLDEFQNLVVNLAIFAV